MRTKHKRKQGMEKFSTNENNTMKNILSRMSRKLSKPLKHDLKLGLRSGCQSNCEETSELNRGDQFKLCDYCVRKRQLKEFNQWFPRLSEDNKQRCILGFVQRLSSHIEILRHLCRMMAPTFKKDYVYACCRLITGQETTQSVFGINQTLSDNFSDKVIESTLKGYDDMSAQNKLNFLVAVLQSCDMHHIYLVYNLVTTLVQADNTRSLKKNVQISPAIKQKDILIDTGQNTSRPNEKTTEWSTNLTKRSKRGTNLFQFKDLIGQLPAPLAKYILSMLDEVSLRNATKVSSKWRTLVKQLMKEAVLSQQVAEEALLLQGAMSHGVNPTYAKDIDVIVPNVCSQTWNVIYNGEPTIDISSLNEVNFEAAFSGISTRKVIMEEKNIFCGAYNVMILQNKRDNQRVIHTDGGELLAVSSEDHKIRFINATTGKDIGPTISGHAGSIHCLHLCEKKRIILSGSYDTSIRCWSIDSGRCQKIYRGHRSTVLCVRLFKDAVVSGSKDASCRLWDLNTGKCLKVMRHLKAVRSVAISGELVISGCDEGEVKVWHRGTGQMVKKLKGHSSSIMCLKFDRWHIVSGDKDGYAMAWSSQGNHSRCLSVFKHPKEVWCIELAFLRVVTGSDDGRIRIWNLITGQCCRIMRGNSQSDPILHLFPVANRLTVNTHTKILTLIFEEIEWNYDLENDSLPPLTQYTGSSHHSRNEKWQYLNWSENRIGSDSFSNSNLSKSFSLLGQKSNSQIQRMSISEDSKSFQLNRKVKSFRTNHLAISKYNLKNRLSHSAQSDYGSKDKMAHSSQNCQRTSSKLKKKDATWQQKSKSESDMKTDSVKKSAVISNNVSQIDQNGENLKSDEETDQELTLVRRLSWSFDPPKIVESKEVTLLETKSLLRSQIRSKTKVKIPEFIRLTRQAYQQQSKLTDVTPSKTHRSFSSPGKIDPRTRISLDQVFLSQLKDCGSSNENKENNDDDPKGKTEARIMTKTTVLTKFVTKYTKTKAKFEMQSPKVKSTIPRGWTTSPAPTWFLLEQDSKSCVIRPFTAFTKNAKSDSDLLLKRGIHSSDSLMQPVQRLIPSKQQMDKIAELQAKYRLRCESRRQDSMIHGRVRLCDDPLRDYAEFHLKTYQEENQEIEEMERKKKCLEMEQKQKQEQKQIAHWLAFSKGLRTSS
ncbi:CMT1A duplicated region transcript 1 protein-like isoform X1 [Octopus sinensis]|uniref:CMT1A duplicated region transcript 1 protein-like isoform X1 n=2 Tax=Octopus sinensis TaxID=2607531 RepID=A0A6P7SKT1_9MOLL|nr:CMT1A duplicated region transcript 1 protein-like isoform X1 [Octopus sinensis]